MNKEIKSTTGKNEYKYNKIRGRNILEKEKMKEIIEEIK